MSLNEKFAKRFGERQFRLSRVVNDGSWIKKEEEVCK